MHLERKVLKSSSNSPGTKLSDLRYSAPPPILKLFPNDFTRQVRKQKSEVVELTH